MSAIRCMGLSGSTPVIAGMYALIRCMYISAVSVYVHGYTVRVYEISLHMDESTFQSFTLYHT